MLWAFLIGALSCGGAQAEPGKVTFRISAQPLYLVAAAIQEFSNIKVVVSSDVRHIPIDFEFPEPLNIWQALEKFTLVLAPLGIPVQRGKRSGALVIHVGTPAGKTSAFAVPDHHPEVIAFRLDHALVIEAELMIRHLLAETWESTDKPPPSVVGSDQRSNTLYIKADNSAGVLLAQQVIASVDRPSDVPGNGQIIELQHQTSHRMQVALQHLASALTSQRDAFSIQIVGPNSLVLRGALPLRRWLVAFAEALDQPGGRWIVSSKVWRVSESVPTSGDQLLLSAESRIEQGGAASLTLSDVIDEGGANCDGISALSGPVRLVARPGGSFPEGTRWDISLQRLSGGLQAQNDNSPVELTRSQVTIPDGQEETVFLVSGEFLSRCSGAREGRVSNRYRIDLSSVRIPAHSGENLISLPMINKSIEASQRKKPVDFEAIYPSLFFASGGNVYEPEIKGTQWRIP